MGTMAGAYKSALQDSDVSTITSTGYELAWQLCVADIAPRLSTRLLDSLRALEALTRSEIDFYPGICHEAPLIAPHDTNEGTKIVSSDRLFNAEDKWDQAVRRRKEISIGV
jgi:hypothetical protein